MVTMKILEKLSVRVIDAAGGGGALACLAAALWLCTACADRLARQAAAHREALIVGRRDLGVLRETLRRQSESLAARQAELAGRGHLPEQAPVESYLQTLAQLADRHHLRVLAQQPMPSRSYPGLLEQRYAYDVSGAAPNLIRFLAAMEKTDDWCDVSYLGLEMKPNASRADGPPTPTASLILSIFSAPPSPASVASKGNASKG
jgi:hypothetical protein